MIAPVRYDVIDYRRRDDLSFCLAERAQRMLLQKKRPCFSPPGIVSPSIRAAAQAVAAPFHMICTENLTLHSEFRTTGIATGSLNCLARIRTPLI